MYRRHRKDHALNSAARLALLAIEPLEARQLMTVNWYDSIGYLELLGSTSADYFALTMISPTEFEVRTSPTVAMGSGARFTGTLLDVFASLDRSSDTLLVQDMAGAPKFTAPMLVICDSYSAIGSGGNDVITTGAGNDTVYGHGGGDVIKTGDGNDTVYGFDVVGTYSSTTAYQDADSVDSGSGNDIVFGGPDKDTVLGADGDDVLSGNEAEDSLNGGAGIDRIDGGDANDTLYGGTGNDEMDGGNGHDSVFGQDGTDVLRGGAGRDTIKGGNHDDRIDGENDHDSLFGELGNDVVCGGVGNDTIDGGGGNDEIDGDDGTDSIAGGIGADVIDGGNDADFIWGASFSVDEIGNDVIAGGDGDDDINAGAGDDIVTGDSGNDEIEGGAGDDRLHGGDGNDVLSGGADEDSLFAGGGHDELSGGDEDDVLVSIDDDDYDEAYGEGGFDSFWIDRVPTSTWPVTTTDTHDADSEENQTNVHKVEEFENGADLSLDGDAIADPTDGTNYLSFGDRPLFSIAGPTAGDISQGSLGDCWILGTLAAAAVANQNVIYQTVADLGDGTYVVELDNKQYRVDGELPRANSTDLLPMYAGRKAMNSLWFALVEKAYALHEGGTYASINGGDTFDVFGRLDARDRDTWDPFGDGQSVLEDIDALMSSGYAATVCTQNVLGPSRPLVGNHCYAVVEVTFDSGHATGVTLYNPWGVDGRGGDSSSAGSNDGLNDGFVTITVAEFEACAAADGRAVTGDFSRFDA